MNNVIFSQANEKAFLMMVIKFCVFKLPLINVYLSPMDPSRTLYNIFNIWHLKLLIVFIFPKPKLLFSRGIISWKFLNNLTLLGSLSHYLQYYEILESLFYLGLIGVRLATFSINNHCGIGIVKFS